MDHKAVPCFKFVEEMIFTILTSPINWRYGDSSSDVIPYTNLKELIDYNTKFLYEEIYVTGHLNPKDEKDEEEYNEYDEALGEALYNMFPIVGSMHADDEFRLRKELDNFVRESLGMLNKSQ